jgi:hypothetical protein
MAENIKFFLHCENTRYCVWVPPAIPACFHNLSTEISPNQAQTAHIRLESHTSNPII